MSDFYTEFDIRTTLSLAVELIDEFAPELKPKGEISVSLTGGIHDIIKNYTNRSGYYIFCDVEDGSYKVETKAKYYLDESLDVVLPRPDPLDPVIKINLKPSPLYTFPDGTTLIKGTVRDPGGDPLPEVNIEVTVREEKTRTTEEGTFVLYFKDIEVETVNLIVNHAVHGTITVAVDITLGKATITEIRYS